jgi:hypothetical protein
MNCKPILFNTEMVKAILEGKKTQTRRLMKPQPTKPRWNNIGWLGWDDGHGRRMKSPCEAGDVLWVRETWSITDKCGLYPNWPSNGIHYMYKADDPDCSAAKEARWYPSIHMPKEAARIFLLVKRVWVECLREISVENCAAEGIWDDYKASSEKYHENLKKAAYPKAFSELWDSTIKKDDLPEYGWNANPWVWAIEFERCEKPEGWN